MLLGKSRPLAEGRSPLSMAGLDEVLDATYEMVYLI